jgi:diamine N-acetyltransferase
MISLRPVDTTNYRECIELSVAPEQQGFVASNLQSLADAYVWREAAEPFAVYADDELVGFALLFPFAGDVDDDAIPEPGTERGMILVRLMIDARFQGRGHGRDGLEAIIELVRDRGLLAVRLSVLPGQRSQTPLGNPSVSSSICADSVSEIPLCVLGRRGRDIMDQPELIAGLRARPRLGGDLLEVGILDDLGRDERRGHQHPHGLVGLVREPMGAVGPAREVGRVPFRELARAVAGAQRRPAAQHHEVLLRAVVEVERQPVPRPELVDGRAQLVATRQPFGAGAAARPVLALVPRVRPDVVVAHGRILEALRPRGAQRES